jgi:hypothetical protein
MSHKYRKSKGFLCFEVLGFLFSGLKSSPVACSTVRPFWRTKDK